MKHLLLFTTIALFFVACSGSNEEKGSVTDVAYMTVPEPAPQNPPIVNQTAVARKLIKEGMIEFETSDVERTRDQVKAAVTKYGAYVSSDQENKSADKISYTLVVRVPSAKFDAFLSSATKDVRYFDRREINVKDVTAEYFDTEIRLKTKKQIELRYLQLLDKASNVKDILSIEKELGTIREEIESAEGQLKLLAEQVQYSTLRINFYKISSTPTVFSYQVSSSVSKGWENLLSVLLMAIDIWPFLLIVSGLWAVLKRRKKRESITGNVG